MTTIAETERTVMRVFRAEDIDAAHGWWSDPEVARYMLWDIHSRAESEARLARLAAILPPGEVGAWVEYAIELKVEGRAVGSVSMKREEEMGPQAEIGWCLSRGAQGRGLAAEATLGLIRHGIELGVHRFYAVADPRNGASVRLMERLGMRREGFFRESCFYKGEWSDDVVYGLLAREVRAG